MQDRYAGDVGDYGKFGMLRQLAREGLRVGLNWYRTYKPEEHHKDDGKHIGYLDNKLFWDCDNELLDAMRQIIQGERSIAALEEADLIPNALYYSEILKPGSDKSFSRIAWHNNALKALKDADVIFCDPDNGLLVKSVSVSSSRSDKYVTENELVDYYSSGKSVAFYNHRCREKEHIYLQRFRPLQRREELETAKWIGLKFVRGTVRDYLFIIQPEHYDLVNDIINRMMMSKWNKHFNKIELVDDCTFEKEPN